MQTRARVLLVLGVVQESQANVENLFKNLGMPVQARGPLFSLEVDWKNGAEAEEGIKRGMAAAGRGTPGGKLEPGFRRATLGSVLMWMQRQGGTG